MTDKTLYKAVYYPESVFGGFSDVDGDIAFYSRINALVRPSFRVVDFGCGRGAHADDPVPFRRSLMSLKGKVTTVIGIDVDSAGYTNPTLDEYRPLSCGPWPLEDKSVNLVFCDCVLEHLPNPDMFFSEARRVIVQGGYLCIRTPNVFSYVGIISKIIPNKHHTKVLAKTKKGRHEEDTFPTLYRCNTIWAVRRQLIVHGFRAVVYGYEPDPTYLNFSKLAYGLGVLHQRFAPSCIRLTLFGFGQLL